MNSNQQDLENIEMSLNQMAVEGEDERRIIEPEQQDGSIKINYKYAGFWMRFWAYILDIIVIGSINRILVYPIFRLLDLPLKESSMFAPISIVTVVIFYAYFILMTKYFGQTLGKMIFGLKVISLKDQKLNWMTIMFREWIGRFISGTILILYIVIGFLPKKQGIHDLFADTTVIHERS